MTRSVVPELKGHLAHQDCEDQKVRQDQMACRLLTQAHLDQWASW